MNSHMPNVAFTDGNKDHQGINVLLQGWFANHDKNLVIIITLFIPYTYMHYENIQGAVSIRKTVLTGMAIPMLKIRRPNGRLIFNMEIAIRR